MTEKLTNEKLLTESHRTPIKWNAMRCNAIHWHQASKRFDQLFSRKNEQPKSWINSQNRHFFNILYQHRRGFCLPWVSECASPFPFNKMRQMFISYRQKTKQYFIHVYSHSIRRCAIHLNCSFVWIWIVDIDFSGDKLFSWIFPHITCVQM